MSLVMSMDLCFVSFALLMFECDAQGHHYIPGELTTIDITRDINMSLVMSMVVGFLNFALLMFECRP